MYAIKFSTKEGKTFKGNVSTNGTMEDAMREFAGMLTRSKLKISDVSSLQVKQEDAKDTLKEVQPRKRGGK